MGVSESKMREALELADAALSGAHMNMNVVEREVKAALAKPAAGVELTDAEILTARMDWSMENDPLAMSVDEWMVGSGRAVIAAHEAKKNGGGV